MDEAEDYNSNYYNQEDIKDEQWELEYDDILNSVEQTLRNVKEDKGGNLKPAGNPLMNGEGINRFLSNLRLVMHRGIALSNLTEKGVMKTTLRLSKSYKTELVNNYEDWEVDETYIRTTNLLFAINVEAVLSRAIKGREQFWRSKKNKFNLTKMIKSKPKLDDDLLATV